GDTDGSAGASFAGGYRINEYLAAEFQGEFALDWLEDALKLGPAWMIGTNVRAYYPLPWLNKRIQPVAIVGLTYLNAPLPDDLDFDLDFPVSSKHYSAFALRAGFGAEIYATEHWAFTFDGTYVMPVSSRLKDFPFASIGWGALYRF
ncbi:MAG: outer membrane beta-barrel protein, partial [Deltaproteobacteria bacterium]|nr:outer membrane beta-barrel protein [Deltaproteobacteria bacterium]